MKLISKTHPLEWVLAPLEEDTRATRKRMFGMIAVYFEHRIVAVVGSGAEPWNGLLLPVDREHHASLLEQWPELRSHPILGKWLYVSQNHEDFESLVDQLTKRILQNDQRFGTIPKPKKARKK